MYYLLLDEYDFTYSSDNKYLRAGTYDTIMVLLMVLLAMWNGCERLDSENIHLLVLQLLTRNRE